MTQVVGGILWCLFPCGKSHFNRSKINPRIKAPDSLRSHVSSYFFPWLRHDEGDQIFITVCQFFCASYSNMLLLTHPWTILWNDSWRVLDLSIAMAYAMISSYGKANRAISAASAVLRGFNSVYPLTLGERKYLRLLISSRLSCSATLGAYSYQQNPQNEYLLLHAEPAWKTLELLWGSKNSGMADAIDNMSASGIFSNNK